MRLWHKDLIPVLPRQQLLGQWRECCLIAKLIHENGTPNHVLVNRVLDYYPDEFNTYADMVHKELDNRGYHTDAWKFFKWRNDINIIQPGTIFRNWHNNRYLRQCLMNLQEKYDAGAISKDDWDKIMSKFNYCVEV